MIPEEWRALLRDVREFATILAMLLVSGAIVSIAVDFRAMRSNGIEETTKLRVGAFDRVDSLLWRMDSLLTIGHTLSNDLDRQLTQVRVQVKESSDDSRHDTNKLAAANTAVVQKSLEQSTKAIEAVVAAADPTPTVKVELPKGTAIIQTPAAPIVIQTPAAKPARPAAEQTPEPRGLSRWLKHIFTPWRHDGK